MVREKAEQNAAGCVIAEKVAAECGAAA